MYPRVIPTGSSWRPRRATSACPDGEVIGSPTRTCASAHSSGARDLSTPPTHIPTSWIRRRRGGAPSVISRGEGASPRVAAVLIRAVFLASALWAASNPAAAAPRHLAAPKWHQGTGKLRPPISSVPDVPSPLRIRDARLEPVAWADVEGWRKDDHAVAFATFVASCRPIARTPHPPDEARPMYAALHAVCGRAVRAKALGEDAARKFFEDNFRAVRIAKLSDAAGFLTGYYEPIVDGSRFPTGIYHVPIYRRPPDML